MKKKPVLDHSERGILAFYLEATIDDLIAMVVDHRDGCAIHSAARSLMDLAGWTEEDLARAYVRSVRL